MSSLMEKKLVCVTEDAPLKKKIQIEVGLAILLKSGRKLK
jgi:hypothetical protein